MRSYGNFSQDFLRFLQNPFLRKIIKSALLPLYAVVNFFYLPFLKNYFFSQIEKVPRSTQLFFLTRFDFGTWLLLMHYAACWHRERGSACLVIFVPNAPLIKRLAQRICPDVEIIAYDTFLSKVLFALFRNGLIQFCTLNRVYAYAYCKWPHALFIFDMTFCRKKPENIARYIRAFDPVLQNPWPFSQAFLDAYLRASEGYDYRRSIYRDMMQLTYRHAKNAQAPKPTQDRPQIVEKLGIQNPYVAMNINHRNYRNALRNNRRIHHPESYNPMIDLLISLGYSVVLQGRSEQPPLAPRKGLIEYFKSPYASAENDYDLFSHCAFAVFPKTGPEVFGPVCNVPVLGLNYTELAAIIPKPRCRFFPKHVWDSKKKEFIHWKDLLQRPCFFDVGILSFEEGIEYVDLSAEELLEATQEFLQLLPLPFPAWLNYTPLQQEFKRSLHPAHIDLYDVSEVPCEAYLYRT